MWHVKGRLLLCLYDDLTTVQPLIIHVADRLSHSQLVSGGTAKGLASTELQGIVISDPLGSHTSQLEAAFIAAEPYSEQYCTDCTEFKNSEQTVSTLFGFLDSRPYRPVEFSRLTGLLTKISAFKFYGPIPHHQQNLVGHGIQYETGQDVG
eukprot:Gb_05663 [translate_table: standard]